MRSLRILGDMSLACAVVVLAGCGAAETSAPLTDGARSLGALQLEAANTLPASINERALSASVHWSPPIDQLYSRLFVAADVIEVADTVRVGEPVSINVNSIGENGCWVADSGTMTQSGDSILIAVYDRHSGAPACTQIWTDRLQHHFSATFHTPGTNVIRAFGRRLRAGAPRYSVPVVATRMVEVLP